MRITPLLVVLFWFGSCSLGPCAPKITTEFERKWVSEAMGAQVRHDCLEALRVLRAVPVADRIQDWYELFGSSSRACFDKKGESGFAIEGLATLREGRREFPRSARLALSEAYLVDRSSGFEAASRAYSEVRELADRLIREAKSPEEVSEAGYALDALRMRTAWRRQPARQPGAAAGGPER